MTPTGTSTHGGSPPRGLRGLGERCARHFVIVIILWVIGLIGVAVLDRAFGGQYADNFTLSGTQSAQGADVLAKDAPSSGGQSAQVVLHDSKSLTDFSSQINQVVGSLDKLPHVITAVNPLPSSQGGTSTALSKNEQIGYITVRFDTNPSSLGPSYVDKVDTAVAPLRAAGVQVEYGGSLGELARPKGNDLRSEGIGFTVAIIVLLIGFGSVAGAVLPLITALLSVIVGLGCLGLLAGAFTFATVSPTLATMIGL
ncbi:MAG TPA: MMPL family transporter, partial [Micromonosporaceae bacterium]|nr:MMPL family transporter [Micromonosporaceae bacterium]